MKLSYYHLYQYYMDVSEICEIQWFPHVIIILGAAAATHQAAEDVESGGEPLQALGRAKLDLCGALKRLFKFVQLRESH